MKIRKPNKVEDGKYDRKKSKGGSAGQIKAMELSCRFAPKWAPLKWGQVGGLMSLIMDMRNELGDKEGLKLIELGSLLGESSTMFAASNIFEEIYCLDLWDGDEIHQICRDNMERYPQCEMIRGDMFDTLENWEYGEVDAIYLDAAHDYESVRDALPVLDGILKTGGIWSGHDYNPVAWPGVVQALDEFFGEGVLKIYEDSSFMIVKE